MAEFSFVAPIAKGKTNAWRQAIAEIKGARHAAYEESRRKLGRNVPLLGRLSDHAARS